MKFQPSDLQGKRSSLMFGCSSRAAVAANNRRQKRASQANKLAFHQLELERSALRQREADENREIERQRIEERRRFREQRAEEKRRDVDDGEIASLEERIAGVARSLDEAAAKDRQEQERSTSLAEEVRSLFGL